MPLDDVDLARLLGKIETKLDLHTEQDALNFERMSEKLDRIDARLSGGQEAGKPASLVTRREAGGWSAAAAAFAVVADRLFDRLFGM